MNRPPRSFSLTRAADGLALMTALALGSVVPGHAWAGTLYLTVTEGDDSLSDGVCDAECTFRDAVSVACDSEDDEVEVEVEVDSELSEDGIDDDNTAGENVATSTTGGAILAGGDLYVTDTKILDNQATYGGGVAVPGSTSEAFFTRSWIGGNSAEERGGGVWSRAVRLNLFRAEVFANIAAFGGGMYIDLPLDPNMDPILERSALVGNEATSEGGGLWVRSEYAGARDIVNSTISSDIAPDGAWLYLANGGVGYTVTLVSTTVHLNNDGDSVPTYNVAHEESDPVLRYVGSLIDGNCTGKATVSEEWNVVLLVSSDQCTVDVDGRDTWFPFGLTGLSTLTLGEPRFHDNENFGISLDWIRDVHCPTATDQRGATRPSAVDECDSGATEN
jgi:hypothetical protein